jgi:hypothetical protein
VLLLAVQLLLLLLLQLKARRDQQNLLLLLLLVTLQLHQLLLAEAMCQHRLAAPVALWHQGGQVQLAEAAGPATAAAVMVAALFG